MWLNLRSQSSASARGGGGLDLGISLALPAARTICYVEREAFACAYLAAAMREGLLDDAPIWTDLTTFDGRAWCGAVDCLVAGWPCPPYSQAGSRRGRNDPRDLWPHVRRIIAEVRPRLFFGENVSGFASHPDGLARSISDLDALGYRVTATLVSAADVGASHERERCFLLGLLDDTAGPRCDGAGQRTTAEQRGGKRLLGEGRQNLADPTERGQRADGSTPRSGGYVDQPEPSVGNAEREREGPGDRQEPSQGGRRDRFTEPSATVADAERRAVRDEAASLADGADRGTASSTGSELGDAECSGKRAGRGQGAKILDQGLPLFPPGPSELERWRIILAEHADLAPALEREVRGLADGLDMDRSHRLRLYGNGVVPLQAAYALCSLLAHHMRTKR